MTWIRVAGAMTSTLIVVLTAAVGIAAPADTCTNCHQGLDQRLSAPVAGMADDIHAKRGLRCASCHGGDATRAGIDAHDRRAGFVGAPRPEQVPQFCARCHANPGFMRQFNPSIPTDQFTRYLTSVHGMRLREGDRAVATCTSCHGVHPVRSVTDAKSPVFHTNVPATCARCHADASRMQPYGIPTDQFTEYRESVHGQALVTRGLRAAPACNNCHDNHGAVPPGATSVANVCAQCHSATRDYFVRSPHKAAFGSIGIPECIACHGKHQILTPTDAMLGAESGSVCLQCHPAGSGQIETATRLRASLGQLKGSIDEANAVLKQASQAGMDVTEASLHIDEANTQLILARAVTHTLSPAEVAKPAAAGIAAAGQARAAGRAALAELAFRRRGLSLSLIVIALVAVTLWLKLRQLERTSRP